MKEKEYRESLGFKDEIVYHYCSIEALFGILSSKSFWLTSLESSNDSMELKLANKILEQAILELKDEHKKTELSSMLEKIESAPCDKKYEKFRPKYKYYGLSLVVDKDSLTHWERYANNGNGVCIGLNIALIKHLFSAYALPDIVSSWFQTTKILYSNEEQIQYAKDLIMAKIDGFDQMTENNINKVENIFTSIYYTTLATLKPRFKHMGFASEGEHRIYLEDGQAESTSKYFKSIIDLPIINNKELIKNISKNILELASNVKVLKSDLRHGVFRDGIRSYYALYLEEIWSDTLINEIVLGPKCFQNKNELKSFLKQCGLLGTKISVSKIPLR